MHHEALFKGTPSLTMLYQILLKTQTQKKNKKKKNCQLFSPPDCRRLLGKPVGLQVSGVYGWEAQWGFPDNQQFCKAAGRFYEGGGGGRLLQQISSYSLLL